MIQSPYLSVVSGTYNRLSSLQRMVGSVRTSIGKGIPYEIVLVDGGSTDGSLEWMKKQKDVVLIEQGSLLGAVIAFNEGFAKARGKYVVIANDDIEFRYESLMNSVAFMDDNPGAGIGCFNQNRYNSDYTCAKMPSVRNRKQVNDYYGQVCIIPKDLGDKVGWWGEGYHTYAGDNELSCRVWELGLQVVPMEFCCINDFVLKDDLRVTNAQSKFEVHPDSVLWRNRWTRDGLVGPVIPSAPTIYVPSRKVPRLVYAPLYEEKDFPIQLETKKGLLEALSEFYLVTEVNYKSDSDNLYYALKMFQPEVCLIQYHNPRHLTYDMMMKLKDEFRDTLFISWNGDYNEDMLLSNSYIQVARLFDLATFVSTDVATRYSTEGVKYAYWQIGFEDHYRAPDSEIRRDQFDVIFQGNCYKPQRVIMGEMLRFHKEWKVGLFGKWPSNIGSNGITQYDFTAGDILYRSSKIAIGDNMFPNSIGYVSNRIFQVLHTGAFLLQQRIPGMEELLGFEDGAHFVVWNDIYDLETKIKEWIDKPSERLRISRAGKKFVDENHSFKRRVEEFQKMVADLKLKKNSTSH